MDTEALTQMLDDCLLTDEEVASDERKWHKTFTDPFPKWNMGVVGF